MSERASAYAMTHAEFLAFEESVDDRHAFHDGVVYAMAGGTLLHGTVGTRLTTLLNTLLAARGCGCFAFGPDVRLTPREGDSMYPDVSVACPPRDAITIERPPRTQRA